MEKNTRAAREYRKEARPKARRLCSGVGPDVHEVRSAINRCAADRRCRWLLCTDFVRCLRFLKKQQKSEVVEWLAKHGNPRLWELSENNKDILAKLVIMTWNNAR